VRPFLLGVLLPLSPRSRRPLGAWTCSRRFGARRAVRPLGDAPSATHEVRPGSDCVLHVAVTRSARDGWVAQQLRNATAYGEEPRFLLCTRDAKFGALLDRVAAGVGARILRSAVRAAPPRAAPEAGLPSADPQAGAPSICGPLPTSVAELRKTGLRLRSRATSVATSQPQTRQPARPPCHRAPSPAGRSALDFAHAPTRMPRRGTRCSTA
jgi:hypothetical protein